MTAMRWFTIAILACALGGAGCGDDAKRTADEEVPMLNPPAPKEPAVALKGRGWVGERVDVSAPNARVTAIAFFKPG
jgi:hypothetical protein